MSKPAPIRVGDRFQDGAGKVWKCIESKPLGVRDFILEGGARFLTITVAQLRLNPMKRLPICTNDMEGAIAKVMRYGWVCPVSAYNHADWRRDWLALKDFASAKACE